ncbi:hypothetical protein M011DRAFT_100246 [Sporormia fimetaria CBS 119925]|uniref:Uncharacterized protein n=1 Tax=Sporormia fimetaria CBS 119925 TaxID=1340428 RepID=A0A6A6V8Z4_9PLEO|nr:hypothetical protein M011DRAFT_100246 [Sporormia fimetaria CBS 119925]
MPFAQDRWECTSGLHLQHLRRYARLTSSTSTYARLTSPTAAISISRLEQRTKTAPVSFLFQSQSLKPQHQQYHHHPKQTPPNMPRQPLTSHQPLTTLYTLLLLSLSPFYFLFLTLKYTLPFLRPHPNWTLRTSLVLWRFCRRMFETSHERWPRSTETE